MKRALHLLAALAAIMATFGTPKAHAALTFCNRTSYILYAATSSVSGPERLTQGWTRIAPGDCQVAIATPLTASAYYVYARSSLAHSGPARAWGGNVAICVHDANFAVQRAAQAFDCSDGFEVPFASLDTHRKPSWTMNFDETPSLGSLAGAQLAGVKRLLGDNGYKIGKIDPAPDKATEAALNAFRKRMRFAPSAGNVELFDALESEAFKTATPAGYTVCNDTEGTVMAALGEKMGANWVSRGWWKIAGGACGRLLDSLKADTLYLLAQKPDGGRLVGGIEKFCVTNIEFEISGRANCVARGLTEAGFAPTSTRGLAGYVAHVGDSGLLPPLHTAMSK